MKQNAILKMIQLTATVLAALLLFGAALPGFAVAVSGSGEGTEPVMVSLGDSYSSGEGVEPFYCAGRQDRYSQPDWLAHRSRLSWPGKLQLTDSEGNRLTMSKNKAFYDSKTKSYDSYSQNNWYFVASSGAVTASLKGTQGKSYDRDPKSEAPMQAGHYTLDSQLKVFESIAPGTTDYVTMTMGGNDAHFADVFIYAALNPSILNVNGMDDYLNTIWDEFYNGSNSIKNRLIQAYKDIHQAAGDQADIIIAGYPKILPKTGFLLFSETESASIDSAITKLNLEMKAIIDSLRTDTFKIHFVSVEEAFDGHEIYTGPFQEYINGLKFVREQDLSEEQIISSYSLHPNRKGVKAYAECVQACIDEIEAEKQSTIAICSEDAESESVGESEEAAVAETQPQAPEQPTADVSFESGEVKAEAGESVAIPVSVSGNAMMKRCKLRFAFDSEQVRIDSVTSADLCEDGFSTTLGLKENDFDVTWHSADSAVKSGTLFYLNATVLTEEETVIRVSAVKGCTYDKNSKTLSAQCEDILINEPGVCTITADVSEFACLQGAQVSVAEDSLCPAENDAAFAVEGTAVEMNVIAAAAQAQILFAKPGFTTLRIVIDGICGGETIDLTEALRQAAAGGALMRAGDVNGDGCVSDADVEQLASTDCFGTAVSKTDAAHDLNADGFVSLEDIAIALLSDNFDGSQGEQSIIVGADTSAGR